MKLLTVISGSISDTYGGGQEYIRNLLRGFSEQGIMTTVLSFVPQKEIVQKREFDGHLLVELGCLSSGWKETAERFVAQVHPDIIHAHGEKKLTMAIASKFNIPCVVTAHHGGLICPAGALLNTRDEICNVKVNDDNCLRCMTRGIPCGSLFFFMLRILPLQWRIRLSHYFEKKKPLFLLTPLLTATGIILSKQDTIAMLKKTAVIVSPCERMKDCLNTNGIIGNVKVIPHGIPFLPPKPLPQINGKIKFMYVGRINYVKGLHILMEAFSKIDQNRYELHIIGEAANRREQHYKNRLRHKYSAVNTIWHGKVNHSEISTILSECHVMVLPTICLEIFGLTIAEALSVGRPVLATRCGGAEMQIEDEQNGWLVQPNNVPLMRKAIIRVIDSPELIQKCSCNCHATVFQKHIDSLMALYEETISKVKQQA